MAFTRHTSKDVAGYNKVLLELCWNREGNYLGMISSDRSVKVGQLDKSGTFQNVHNIPTTTTMTQLCWNPVDDSRIGMCGEDKYVELWDVRASKASMKLPTSANNISIGWSPCGTFMAVGNKSDLVTVFDLRTGSVLRKKKFNYEVNDIVWTANPNYLLAATGGDGAGYLDILSLLNPTDPEAALTDINNIHISSAASNSSSTSNTSSAAGELSLLQRVTAHVDNCISLRIDPACRRLAVGGLDRTVSFWDLEDMVCLHTTPVESEVRGMTYSGDGQYLAVVGVDTNIYICDTSSAEAVSKVVCRHKVSSASWHPQTNLNLLAVALEDRSPAPQYLRFLAFPTA
uniref:Anaphase-promoting complex subunit 4-like WD40 domain-containing protein n=1 Tax=Spumella elongata TaxID=89044 RepID=A0A7S3M2X7_9STRA